MNQYITIDNRTYKYKLSKHPVFFKNEEDIDIINKVIDDDGKILNFPGIIEKDFWMKEKRLGEFHDVRFEARFYKLPKNQYLMLWLIQPDGMYWMDDLGFGIEPDLSIELYSLINESGEFIQPFQIFCLDKTRYCEDYDDYVENIWK